ncbi:hypothetical protein P5673_022842 [Acropora cervicornis]|uniref:Uncharacterized protein n=1 Tax=Acropora cervicornis TaxID=6130 RepID=A0AAD9Q680_ACRCE|nr:hypothetical protein P5673_022842 [Acropora cervicornis]
MTVSRDGLSSHEDAQRCKVCGEKYKLTTRRTWIPTGLSVRQWIQTTVILSMMVGTPLGVYLVCLTEIPPTCKILVLGLAVVLEYVCLRLMGLNMLNVYRRARLATMTIVGRPVTRIEELPEENQPTAEARAITAA